jgi:hypothetical protein
MLRGLVLIPLLATQGLEIGAFALWSSLIVLVYGLAYTIGTYTSWPNLAA